MVRPCVARGFRRSGGRAVLHQCIRLLIGACCAPSHHGYQRACGLISGPASNGPFGSPVFACAGKTDPPSRLILSQTSAGKGCRLPHRLLLACSVPLFVLAVVLSSRPTILEPDQAGRDAISAVLIHSKVRSLLRPAQAMRASLLASAIASTLWCNRFLAASIQGLSP